MAKKNIQENKKIHRQKLRAMSKRIDNELPSACKYPLVKSKRELIIEGKLNASYSRTFF
jgi:hypothetical protein